jgi:transposase
MSKITLIGIDTAKSVFHLVGIDQGGKYVWRRRLSRAKLLPSLAQIEPCVVVLEACAASHHWARQIAACGHQARLIAPQHVKPYRRGQKNDYRDAEAIISAALSPGMYFVGVKGVEQQAEQALHRVRSRLLSHRNAAANELRGLLGEYGCAFAKGLNSLRQGAVDFIDRGEVTIGKLPRGRDRYVRQLLIHGARSVVNNLGDKTDPRSCWLRGIVERRSYNTACVALAHKNARQGWGM